MDYKTSGVDIEAGNSFVNKIKDTVMSTHRPEVMGGFGGFNGAIKIPYQYKNPLLVSGADGVGTKLKLAHMWGIHENVGKDLVAMCVNDVITCGAEPLYFLDYIATGKLEPNVLGEVVDGIAQACIEAGCSLIGGETAEMPSMYHNDEYDLAGFSKNELNVYTEYGKLIVEGKKEEKEKRSESVYQGLAQRSFNRTWSLSEDIEVREVQFKDGLLTVKLGKIVPEHHARKEYM